MQQCGIADLIVIPLQRRLGKWKYKSKTHDAFCEGVMFPLNVTEVLTDWPEMDVRERRWVSGFRMSPMYIYRWFDRE